MRINRRVKIVCVGALIILLVSILLTLNSNTYSLFSKVFSGCGSVKAAGYEDIIEYIYIDKQNPGNIRIKKANSLDYDPVVFFEVRDEASEYILHIDPIKLGTNEENIPIRLNINLKQFLDLLFDDSKQVIRGNIYVKYLNNYFSEEYQFEFTKLYILNSFLRNIGLEEFDKINKGTIKNKVIEIRRYIQERKNTYFSEGETSSKIQPLESLTDLPDMLGEDKTNAEETSNPGQEKSKETQSE